ncbi:hypothetical protein CEXT_612431 [Caerostris extrusa]|uniref:Uncharacterized protein n=1 Tax=Caerostris extrusa TaxID=172846 RepID=A0AAV4NG59_CAEEX|nr:hypothetical protein CEXT_612431 [Caerostris extrusa]
MSQQYPALVPLMYLQNHICLAFRGKNSTTKPSNRSLLRDSTSSIFGKATRKVLSSTHNTILRSLSLKQDLCFRASEEKSWF